MRLLVIGVLVGAHQVVRGSSALLPHRDEFWCPAGCLVPAGVAAGETVPEGTEGQTSGKGAGKGIGRGKGQGSGSGEGQGEIGTNPGALTVAFDGHHACENNYARAEVMNCWAVGCCQWSGGTCWSDLEKGEACPTMTGEMACEGRFFDAQQCSLVPCCTWENGACWSAVGTKSCVDHNYFTNFTTPSDTPYEDNKYERASKSRPGQTHVPRKTWPFLNESRRDGWPP